MGRHKVASKILFITIRWLNLYVKLLKGVVLPRVSTYIPCVLWQDSETFQMSTSPWLFSNDFVSQKCMYSK